VVEDRRDSAIDFRDRLSWLLKGSLACSFHFGNPHPSGGRRVHHVLAIPGGSWQGQSDEHCFSRCHLRQSWFGAEVSRGTVGSRSTPLGLEVTELGQVGPPFALVQRATRFVGRHVLHSLVMREKRSVRRRWRCHRLTMVWSRGLDLDVRDLGAQDRTTMCLGRVAGSRRLHAEFVRQAVEVQDRTTPGGGWPGPLRGGQPLAEEVA
jgi:hypothetical protein